MTEPLVLQGWFTLAASLVAALAAVGAAALASVAAARARRWTTRDHWWQRFTSAVEQATRDGTTERRVAIATLDALTGVKWAADDDNQMVMIVADIITAGEGVPPASDSRGLWWMKR